MNVRQLSFQETLNVTDIDRQIDIISRHPLFSVSPILKKFLSFICRETLRGNRNKIKAYTIALSVLDKPSSFDPNKDSIVRVHAARLRNALEQYYLHSKKNEIRISMLPGSYIPSFEPIKSDREHSIPMRKTSDTQTPDVAKDLIAVFPFRHCEKEPVHIGFVENLPGRFISDLGSKTLDPVLSFYSSKQLSEKNTEMEKLAAKKGIRHLITGSVQFVGNSVRVIVHLIQTNTGVELASEVYNLTFIPSRIFEMQEEISEHFISSLIRKNILTGRSAKTVYKLHSLLKTDAMGLGIAF